MQRGCQTNSTDRLRSGQTCVPLTHQLGRCGQSVFLVIIQKVRTPGRFHSADWNHTWFIDIWKRKSVPVPLTHHFWLLSSFFSQFGVSFLTVTHRAVCIVVTLLHGVSSVWLRAALQWFISCSHCQWRMGSKAYPQEHPALWERVKVRTWQRISKSQIWPEWTRNDKVNSSWLKWIKKLHVISFKFIFWECFFVLFF